MGSSVGEFRVVGITLYFSFFSHLIKIQQNLLPPLEKNVELHKTQNQNTGLSIEKHEFKNNTLATEFPPTHRARQQTYTAISNLINMTIDKYQRMLLRQST